MINPDKQEFWGRVIYNKKEGDGRFYSLSPLLIIKRNGFNITNLRFADLFLHYLRPPKIEVLLIFYCANL